MSVLGSVEWCDIFYLKRGLYIICPVKIVQVSAAKQRYGGVGF